MKHVANVMWAVVLGVAVVSIVGGFASAQRWQGINYRALQAAPARVAAGLPTIGPRPLERSLFGLRAPDATFDPDDDTTPLEDVVVERPAGWAPTTTPTPRDIVKLAIVIRDAGYDRVLDDQFKRLPIPLTYAVSAQDAGLGERFGDDPSAIVVAIDRATQPAMLPARIKELHAGGLLTPLVDPPPLPTMLAGLKKQSIFVIDGMGDNGRAFEAARARNLRAATRDLVIDARDEQPYIAYMIRQAARLAHRTGVAVAIGHARSNTLAAMEATLPRLERDGVEIVPVGALVR